jgi:hypothetical protein
MRTILAAITTLAVASTMASGAVLVSDDFNSYTGLTTGATPLSTNWNTNASATNNPALLATAGLSGTQSIGVASGTGLNPDFSYVNKTAVDWTAISAPITMSVFFQRGTTGSGQGNPDLEFVGSDTQVINSNPALGARVNGSSSLEIRSNNSGGFASTSVSLTTGNWYQLVVSYTRSTPNVITVSTSLFNSDSAGVVGTQVGSTVTANFTAHALYSDSSIYGGVRLTGNSTGQALTQSVDNFEISVIPEPATLATCLATAGVMLLRRRSI